MYLLRKLNLANFNFLPTLANNFQFKLNLAQNKNFMAKFLIYWLRFKRINKKLNFMSFKQNFLVSLF